MNYKIKRKSWRRLAASLLAGLCLLTGSGAALAAQAAGAAVTQAASGDVTTATPETAQAAADSEAVATPETATPEQVTEATPETAASAARLSFTVLDSDYQAPASGNIDESLFAIESDEARMPAGEAVPVLLQAVDPAPDSTVTVTLSDGAVFTDSEMAADDGSTYTRTFTSGEQASAWMLYVRADGDFTAEATYAEPTDSAVREAITRTISVTRYHKISLFSVFSARAGEHQYHITDVTNVGGEWLITFEGEDQSYCLDEGMNGKPSASVYWTYYGTTDLLDQALAAGCSSKLDIQRYVWAHRQEASNSGSAYVYQASEAGWQNVMTRYPPVDQPTEPDQPEETPPPTYDANWSVNVSESASAEFAVSMTVAVDKTAAITGERLDDVEITVTPQPASGNLDGGNWSVSPDHEIIRTVNGDGSVTFSYKGSVTKSASRSDSGSVSGAASQEEADAAAESERAQAESALRAEARADAQNQANAAAAVAAEQAREFLVKETGVPQGFSATGSSEQTVTVHPNGSVTATIQNQPWRATVRWEKLDALTGGRLTEDTKFVLYEWSQTAGDYAVSPNYRVVRLADGTYSVTVTNDSYTGWQEGCVYYTQDNLGKFKIEEAASAYGYTAATQDGAGPWRVEFVIDEADKVVEYLGTNADRNRPWGNRVVIHKTDSETGQAIAANAQFTLYEWNAARGVYEVSTNYAIERAGDGSYTVACLHPDWTLAEAGQLYFEDTLCDTRADTANHDGTTSNHEIFYGVIDLKQYPNDRAFTNDGQFLIVETQAPDGYFGDWTDITNPGTSGSDLGKRAYYLRLTGDGSTITLDNAAYNADILTENQGGVLVETPDGAVTVQIYGAPKDATRIYTTDSTGLANNEDAYTTAPVAGKFTNDRVIGEIILAKADLDQLKESVPRALTDEDGDNSAVPGGALHGTASIEGAVYDLYAAEDIQHPDGVSGVVDYSKIVDANGNPIWHTTVLTNGGWGADYLPVLAKDHLVASGEIRNGVLAFSNLYLGKYYLVERATGIVLPVDTDGHFYVTGQYPVLDKTLQPTGETKSLNTSRGEYTDYVYKNQFSAVAEGRALTGVKTYDGYYLSYAEGYLCDETNHYHMDDFIITEEYSNHETLGRLTIRKVGNVLTGYEDGQFIYEQANLAGATYEIRAHGDIATGDRQGTLWYADGDLVATVTTGEDGQVDEVKFSPTRTPATYDFLSVSHDGTTGEVTITLPLGSYDVTEVQAPYGFVLTDQTYTVTFGWNDQSNDVVLAQTIVDHTQDGDETYSYDIINAADASDEQLTGQPGTIVFENARVLPVPETPEDLVDKIGVGIHKQDAETGQPLAGAVYELYTVDAIYDVNGSKLADAGTLLATSAPTDDTGFTWFDVDVPIRGEAYANGETEPADGVWNARYNSGNYQIVEITSPDGYLLDRTPIAVSFTYPGPQVAWQVVAATQADQPLDKLTIHKTDVGGKELPGAELTVTTLEGKPIDSWVSEETPHTLPIVEPDAGEQDGAIHYSDEDNEFVYILHEDAAPDGYLVATDIQFKAEQDEEGHIVVFTRATDADSWHKTDGASVTMVDAAQPQPTPTPTPTTTVTVTATPTPAPIPHVPQTGDSTPLLAMVIATVAAAAGFIALLVMRRRKNRLDEENDPQLEPRDDPEDTNE